MCGHNFHQKQVWHLDQSYAPRDTESPTNNQLKTNIYNQIIKARDVRCQWIQRIWHLGLSPKAHVLDQGLNENSSKTSQNSPTS